VCFASAASLNGGNRGGCKPIGEVMEVMASTGDALGLKVDNMSIKCMIFV